MAYKFDKTTRYITCGIENSMPLYLQATLWGILDTFIAGGGEADYLQVFKFERTGDVLVITHTQEEPEHKMIVYLEYDETYQEVLEETIFIIDDIDHSTMLFGSEY